MHSRSCSSALQQIDSGETANELARDNKEVNKNFAHAKNDGDEDFEADEQMDVIATENSQRYALQLAYFGPAFCGFQRQASLEFSSAQRFIDAVHLMKDVSAFLDDAHPLPSHVFFNDYRSAFDQFRLSPTLTPPTVQQCLEWALSKVFNGNRVIVHSAGRTDGGVHALSQYVHFDVTPVRTKSGELRSAIEGDSLKAAVNSYLNRGCLGLSNKDRELLSLPPENRRGKFISPLWPGGGIQVLSARKVSKEFHARRCCVERTYIYRFAAGIQPLLHDKSGLYFHPSPIDLSLMQKAATLFLGTHDFSQFRAVTQETAFISPIRRINSIDIRISPTFSAPLFLNSTSLPIYEVEFRAHSFLHNQIRKMMGFLLGVAAGRAPIELISHLLELGPQWQWPLQQETEKKLQDHNNVEGKQKERKAGTLKTSNAEKKHRVVEAVAAKGYDYQQLLDYYHACRIVPAHGLYFASVKYPPWEQFGEEKSS